MNLPHPGSKTPTRDEMREIFREQREKDEKRTPEEQFEFSKQLVTRFNEVMKPIHEKWDEKERINRLNKQEFYNSDRRTTL